MREARGTAGSNGVLTADYASSRKANRAVRYRYQARARLAHELAQKYMPFKGHYVVLDLGCAEGRTLLELRRLFGGRGRFVGVEAAQELLDMAPPLPEDTRLLHGDACELPDELAAGSFDMVCALALLEHLERPESVARAARRLLKPGGIFVATCPHPLWDAIAGRLALIQDEAHLQKMDRQRMLEIAQVVGPAEYVPFMSVALGSLPYGGVPVPAKLSASCDQLLRLLPAPLSRPLFVNQAVVSQKPR